MKNQPYSITWQQIPGALTFTLGMLVVLASIFGTFALSQYRIGQLEDSQKITNDTINRLDRSVLVIATKMGISEKDLQSRVLTPVVLTQRFEPETPGNQNITVSTQQTSEPSATPVVTSHPAPTPGPTPTQNVLPNIPILERISNL